MFAPNLSLQLVLTLAFGWFLAQGGIQTLRSWNVIAEPQLQCRLAAEPLLVRCDLVP